MRILLFLEICLIAVGIWSLVMMLYRLFLMPAKEDFAPLVLPVGEQADSVEGRLRWAYWQTRSGGKYGFLYILDCLKLHLLLWFSQNHLVPLLHEFLLY